jgi:hypothetical protein
VRGVPGRGAPGRACGLLKSAGVTGEREAAEASVTLGTPDVDAGEAGTGGSVRAASWLSALGALISLPWRAAASADRSAFVAAGAAGA